MTDVGLLSLPIFAIVALGWAATRTRLVSAATLDALGTFAFRFALPALVFRLIAGQPLDRFLGLLGGAAAPTALFAPGGALALQRIDRATALSAAAITVAKLVARPVLAWIVLAHLLHACCRRSPRPGTSTSSPSAVQPIRTGSRQRSRSRPRSAP